jgi:myo-inositol-1(or 4)-monophosphatase
VEAQVASLERHLEAARQAARESGRIQIQGMSQKLQVDHKGRYDLVTDVDRKCEEVITGILQEAFPQVGMLAEESAENNTGSGEYWIVDPLDGTTNYASGYPAFCTNIALKQKGEIVLGVVYEPVRDELFEAVRGGGARLNGAAIRVSETGELSQALLATGFPYDRCEQPRTNLDSFCALTMRTRGVRRGGSASLDLCYTACGRLDGYWEIRLQPWDVCAGALMVFEAGGQVSDLKGQEYDWSGDETLASNRRLHDELVASLATPLDGGPCYG